MTDKELDKIMLPILAVAWLVVIALDCFLIWAVEVGRGTMYGLALVIMVPVTLAFGAYTGAALGYYIADKQSESE